MSNTGEPIVPSGEPVAGPTVTYREPDDYQELRAFREAFDTEIRPYWADIEPILKDEDTRTYVRSARETLAEQRERAKPRIAPEFEPLVKHFEDKWSPVVEYVTKAQEREAKAEQEREATTKAEQQRGFDSNKAYAERIMAERSDFRTADGNPSPMMEDLIILAAQRKLSIEDAYKEYGPKYFGVKPQAVDRPRTERTQERSLRSGDPGVPGESSAPKATTQKERLARMRANMINSGRGA